MGRGVDSHVGGPNAAAHAPVSASCRRSARRVGHPRPPRQGERGAAGRARDDDSVLAGGPRCHAWRADLPDSHPDQHQIANTPVQLRRGRRLATGLRGRGHARRSAAAAAYRSRDGALGRRRAPTERAEFLDKLDSEGAQVELDLGQGDTGEPTFVHQLHQVLIYETTVLMTGGLLQRYGGDATFGQMLAYIARYLDPTADDHRVHQRLAAQSVAGGHRSVLF